MKVRGTRQGDVFTAKMDIQFMLTTPGPIRVLKFTWSRQITHDISDACFCGIHFRSDPVAGGVSNGCSCGRLQDDPRSHGGWINGGWIRRQAKGADVKCQLNPSTLYFQLLSSD